VEYFSAEKLQIDLRGLEIPGRILDIGGGGEGIISRCFGDRVVAIDTRKDELEESPDFGLKIIMDARELKFLDESFENVTCFYSLMYMDEADINTVLAEAYRVLAPGGSLWIWDAVIPYPPTADAFLAPLEITLPGEVISTTYGISWHKKQSLESISEKCKNAGFTVVSSKDNGQGFYLQSAK